MPIPRKSSSPILRHLAIFLSVLMVIYSVYYLINRSHTGIVIYTDREGYYMYLPAVFIYDGFEKVPVATRWQYSHYPGTNKVFTKFTYGVALLQSPFFLITHAWEKTFDPRQATGYTIAYERAIAFATCFYTLLGLVLIFYSLRRKFSLFISLLSTALLLTGTNLLYYTVSLPGTSHNYSLFLFSLFIYLTPLVIDSARLPVWLAYGWVYGLITLVRPTSGILILYPLLYGCYSVEAFKLRLAYFAARAKYILAAAILSLLVFIPQFIYWKYVSGSYLIYSYDKEGFTYWKNPKMLQVLFDVLNGWFIYTPLMLLAVLGTLYGIRKKMPESLPVIVILTIATYISGSWWCWWYGSNLGQRSYIEFYGFLAFGLAPLLYAVRSSRASIAGLGLVITICVYYNIGLTCLHSPFTIWDGPDWDWDSLGKVISKLI
jgi:hypothetical protein